MCGIVNPVVVEVDIDKYPSEEDLGMAILNALETYAPDLLVIATEDGDAIWDLNGLFEDRPPGNPKLIH